MRWQVHGILRSLIMPPVRSACRMLGKATADSLFCQRTECLFLLGCSLSCGAGDLGASSMCEGSTLNLAPFGAA
jgi:hypothetical protein